MIEQHRERINLLTRVPSQNLEWQHLQPIALGGEAC